MRNQPRRFGLTTKSFVYALGIHALIGALLLVSFNFDLGKVIAPSVKQEVQPVQATVVAEADVQKQLEAIEARENKKKLEQQQAEKRLKDLLEQTKQAEKKRKEEEKRLAKIKEEKKKKAEEKKKAEALAKKNAEEKKKKEELAKAKKEKERLAKAKKEEERKRKEAEKKKQAELARKKKAAEEKRRKELALQKRLEEERQQAAFNSLLAQYTPIIRQKVSRNWNQPASTQRGIAAQVVVKLTATGEVISARVSRSSGNSVFDRSVENAVYKASPLPIPQERGINEKFRNLNLTFRPEDLFS
ncbi:MAG: cell envelope integrity protein TolA [Arenicellales bacterium]|nr:cell envelope integrity protein TolA [Arenicellales bacterium]